ncbi:MAG TPA: DegT/DnrJ/EryC1/StrS family aminotransferase [Anaerolineae bacterium]|nr:DegT/DnrJ/EryC1/StrS family aminotransferase [Anaerolineae bacterium]
MEKVLFGDLKLQYRTLQPEIDEAVRSVLESGWFVLGQSVTAFEAAFARYCSAASAIGVANGTDALQLALMACGIGPGDEVITAPNSATFTALAISAVGARPAFVDIDPATYNLDPQKLADAITSSTRAIIPVHLFGQPAPMDQIMELARQRGIQVIEDAAQAHGARYNGRHVGTIGDLGCFSFYPSKNLGAYGDGGLVTSNNPELAERVRMLRHGGQKSRYDHQLLGRNSRLDELQAAILLAKLPHLEQWNERRRHIAALYTAILSDTELALPFEARGAHHVYHLYVIRTPHRDALQKYLADRGIETAIHYPTPIHLQEAYRWLGLAPGSFPVAESLASQLLSLPIYPELTDSKVRRVAEAIRDWSTAQRRVGLEPQETR